MDVQHAVRDLFTHKPPAKTTTSRASDHTPSTSASRTAFRRSKPPTPPRDATDKLVRERVPTPHPTPALSTERMTGAVKRTEPHKHGHGRFNWGTLDELAHAATTTTTTTTTMTKPQYGSRGEAAERSERRTEDELVSDQAEPDDRSPHRPPDIHDDTEFPALSS